MKARLERFTARIGNPIEWCYVDKCLLVIALAMVPTGSVALQTFWLEHTVSSLPNFSPWVVHGLRWAQIGFEVTWFVLLCIGFYLRQRDPGNVRFIYATAVVFALSLLPAAYFTGMFSGPFWMSIVALGVIGSLLFPARYVAFGMSVALGGTVVLLAAVWLGWLPYASLLESPPRPIEGSDGGLVWVIMNSANALLFSTVVGLPFIYVVRRWRLREKQVAQALRDLSSSEQRLARATELIRRYVATQVADHVLAGDDVPLPANQRRVITVFYSDIKGFTEASDQMDTEDLSRILNEYLSEMSTIALAHGGTIDKFVGDAMMIFFGAPSEMPEREQALAAVRMAMAMGKRMVQLRAKWFDEGMQFPFEKRVGINTGVAAVGNFGSGRRLDYTVIGRQVMLAAKLEGACEPGRILISEMTWELVRSEVACTPRGLLDVPFLDAPVAVFEVDA